MTMFVLRACLLAGALLTPTHADEDTMPSLSVEGFSTFLQSHHLSFPRGAMRARLALYRGAAAHVRLHNSLPDRTYDLAVNQFSTMTESERKQYLGMDYNATEADKSHMVPEPRGLMAGPMLPSSVDRTRYGTVGPVKDQGACGSCWAFAATAVFETTFAETTWKLRRFADQELLDCTYESQTGKDGCYGGMYDAAWEYLKKDAHFSPEKEIGYNGRDGPCNYAGKRNWMGEVRVVDWKWTRTDDGLMQALFNTAVSIAMKVEGDFFSYKSGIFGGCATPLPINHAMAAVGYDAQSWKVKNSWGAGWGEGGFVRVSRGRANNCGISTYAAYPVLDWDISSVVLLKNYATGRYLSLQSGGSEDIRDIRAREGYGSMKLIGTDLNYYDDALWIIKKRSDGTRFIEHWHTGRYVLDPSLAVKAPEGGWLSAQQLLASDANYYNLADWNMGKSGGYVTFQNVKTKRFIFSGGDSVKGKDPIKQYGDEKIVASDANYYSRAFWEVVPLTEKDKNRMSPSGAHDF